MAYPLQSNFTSASLDDAWWSYTRDNGTTNICSTTGAAILRRLRQGPPVAWDDTLQSALMAQAAALSLQQGAGWNQVISQLTSDQASRTVSRLAMTFAIYLAYYRNSNLRLDAIGIPSDAILPQWGVVVADRDQNSNPGITDDLVCFDPNSDSNPLGLTPSDIANVQSQSSSGIRLHPGESLPTVAPPPPNLSGVNNWVLGLLAVGVVGIVGYFVYATDPATKSRGSLRRTSRRPRAR